jgi:hypothetical protein
MCPLSNDAAEMLSTDTLRRLVVELSLRLGALEEQVAELGVRRHPVTAASEATRAQRFRTAERSSSVNEKRLVYRLPR